VFPLQSNRWRMPQLLLSATMYAALEKLFSFLLKWQRRSHAYVYNMRSDLPTYFRTWTLKLSTFDLASPKIHKTASHRVWNICKKQLSVQRSLLSFSISVVLASTVYVRDKYFEHKMNYDDYIFILNNLITATLDKDYQ